MRLRSLLSRLYRSRLVMGLLSMAVLLGFTSRYWLPENLSHSPGEASISLHAISEMVLVISNILLAATFVAMYRKCKGLLSFRGIFLVFALFMAASGLTRALDLLMFAHRGLSFTSELEMVSATLAVVSAGIVAALTGKIQTFLLAARQSQRNEARFIAASESSLEAFYTLQSVRDKNGQIIDFEFTYLNTNGEKLVGLPREEIIGQYLCALIPVNRTGGFFDEYREVVMTGRPVVQEFPMQLNDDMPRWIRHEVVRLEDGIAITAADITDRKLSDRANEHRAQHDVLTNLPNRSLLKDRLQQAIDRAVRYRSKVGLFLVDMDKFKEINDTRGHPAGDQVLIAVAQRLRESVRGSDSVLRIGGDEFIVVMPDVQEEKDIRRLAAKINTAVLSGAPAGLEDVDMSCSIGVAVYPSQAATADELISRADAAMYEAKRRGGGCFEVFSDAIPAFEPKDPAQPKYMRVPRPAPTIPRPVKRVMPVPDA